MSDSRFLSLLEEVLSYTQSDPAAAARAIYSRYGSFTSLAAADIDELAAIPEVGERGAHLLRLSFSIYSRKETDKFKFGRRHTTDEILAYLKALFFPLSNETVYALLVDSEGRVISSEFIGEGTVNAIDILPRKILELMVKKKARSVILAHNHPAGVAIPSREDVETTVRIAELLTAADRVLEAHYLIAGDEHAEINN